MAFSGAVVGDRVSSEDSEAPAWGRCSRVASQLYGTAAQHTRRDACTVERSPCSVPCSPGGHRDPLVNWAALVVAPRAEAASDCVHATLASSRAAGIAPAPCVHCSWFVHRCSFAAAQSCGTVNRVTILTDKFGNPKVRPPPSVAERVCVRPHNCCVRPPDLIPRVESPAPSMDGTAVPECARTIFAIDLSAVNTHPKVPIVQHNPNRRLRMLSSWRLTPSTTRCCWTTRNCAAARSRCAMWLSRMGSGVTGGRAGGKGALKFGRGGGTPEEHMGARVGQGEVSKVDRRDRVRVVLVRAELEGDGMNAGSNTATLWEGA